jgi:hypothetical protein
MEGVGEGIAGGLMMFIWRPHHGRFSVSHWYSGTSAAGDSQRPD